MIEGQYTKNDFGSWRSFIFDCQTGNAEELHIKTHNNSSAFANPTATIMIYNGRQILVNTFFIFSEGAGVGEAGELMYYHYLDSNEVVDNRQNLTNDLRIYPIPADKFINIDCKSNSDFCLKSLTGYIVKAGKIRNGKINVEDLHNGIYILTINGKIHKKIIIQHR